MNALKYWHRPFPIAVNYTNNVNALVIRGSWWSAGQTLGRKSRHDLFSREFLDLFVKDRNIYFRSPVKPQQQSFRVRDSQLTGENVNSYSSSSSNIITACLFVTLTIFRILIWNIFAVNARNIEKLSLKIRQDSLIQNIIIIIY